MTTLWWLIVLSLTGCGCFVFGYVVRVQFELYHRQVYELDFTRARIGEKS